MSAQWGFENWTLFSEALATEAWESHSILKPRISSTETAYILPNNFFKEIGLRIKKYMYYYMFQMID